MRGMLIRLRRHVRGVVGPPEIGFLARFPLISIQMCCVFDYCSCCVRVKFPRDTDTQACPRRDLWRATISAT